MHDNRFILFFFAAAAYESPLMEASRSLRLMFDT